MGQQSIDEVLAEMFAPERAKAFVLRHLQPGNEATEAAIEALRIELGLDNRDNIKRALCGFLWACQTLHLRNSDLLSFPASKPTYSADGGGYQAFMSVRAKLLEHGYIKQERKAAADHGRAAIYLLMKKPDLSGFDFREQPSSKASLVEIKRHKDKYGEGFDTKPLSRQDAEQYFGKERFHQEEAKVEHILEYLRGHPLRVGNTTYRHLKRVFNKKSLGHGGRLYGSYSNLPKSWRAKTTIDDQPIVQVDIKASYLSVRAGLSGHSFEEGTDPYQLIPWVNPQDDRTRNLAKELVSALISMGGDKDRFPSGCKAEYCDIIKPSQTIKHYKGPIHEVFPFLLEYMEGLEVAFQESEMMMGVLNQCIEEDLPAWPLHDCIFVRHGDMGKAVEIIKSEFSYLLGFRPTVTTKDHKGKEEII